MRRHLSPILVAACLSIMSVIPAQADEVSFPTYTGDEFNALFSGASLPGLASIGPAPFITGETATDALIRDLAEARGYIRRPLAVGPLTTADGFPVQAEVAVAWEGLQAAAREAGHRISIHSAYRDEAGQRAAFLSKLTGTSVAAIDARLRYSAPPGYSKHHTGYALDITEDGTYFTSFGSTAANQWLIADNYLQAKRFGFIPSYPSGAASQGPVPEPWEWTYVGVETILCGLPSQDGGRFCDDDASVFETDIEWLAETGITAGCNPPANTRFCPSAKVSRGEMAAFLARALELPDAGQSVFGDDDGSLFESDIARVAAAGITLGCNPPLNDRFCPAGLVTRAEMAAFLVRAFGYSDDGGGDLFVDDTTSIFEHDIDRLAVAGITLGCNPPLNDRFCPEASVTRAEMAAFLHRTSGE